MKGRISTFLLFLTLSLNLPLTTFAQKGVKIGFIALPQNTWLINSTDWNSAQDLFNYKPSFGMAAGPVVGYNFTENFGARVNILYSLQGQRWTHINVDDEVVVNKTRLHYLKIPLMVGYNTNTQVAKVIFSVYVGYQMQFLMGAQFHNDDQSYVPDQSLYDNVLRYPKVNERFRRFDHGPVLNMGIDVKLTYNVMANIHFRADYGLSDVEDKNETITLIDKGIPYKESFYPEDRGKTSNITGGILFGLTYTFTDY